MIEKIEYDKSKLQCSDDETLLELIFGKVSELDGETFGESIELATKAMIELYALCVLDAEGKNGGFDQFFWQNAVEWTGHAKKGLERIRAEKYLEIFEHAIHIYMNPKNAKYSERNPKYDVLDQAYYALEDGLAKAQAKYVRNNYEEFVFTN